MTKLKCHRLALLSLLPVFLLSCASASRKPEEKDKPETKKEEPEKSKQVRPKEHVPAQGLSFDESLVYDSEGPPAAKRSVGAGTRDRVKRPAMATPTRTTTGARAAEVKAASHDDNEEFPFYQEYCKKNASAFTLPLSWDVSQRFVIKVMDEDSNCIPHTRVEVMRKKKVLFSAATQASGEIVLFPLMDLGKKFKSLTKYTVRVKGKYKYTPEKRLDFQVPVVLQEQRKLPARIPVQICFLLDATGSMKDEIQKLKDVIFSIHARIQKLPSNPELEFSTVAYKDVTDDWLVLGRPFTANIDTFQLNLEDVRASGGGDYPEDLGSGLAYTLDSLKWKDNAVMFIFLIADAPPHVDYKTDKDYAWGMKQCRKRGIMLTSVGASGLRPVGEFIFRQMSVITNGRFVFLHYGEQGESEGAATAADPGKVSHHTGSNYNVRRLDDIVVDIITRELGYLTPAGKIVHAFPQPKMESELLDIRIENLLRQVIRPPVNTQAKKVVLTPVESVDGSMNALSEYLWDLAIEKIPEVSSLTVVERKKLEDIMKEHKLDMSGVTETGGASKIGGLLSADYIIFSRLHFLGAVRVCHMRLVDLAQGAMIAAARVKL
jgi:hypothetical protein